MPCDARPRVARRARRLQLRSRPLPGMTKQWIINGDCQPGECSSGRLTRHLLLCPMPPAAQTRRAAMGVLAGVAALAAASPSQAAFGDAANVFGKVTNKTGACAAPGASSESQPAARDAGSRRCLCSEQEARVSIKCRARST